MHKIMDNRKLRYGKEVVGESQEVMWRWMQQNMKALCITENIYCSCFDCPQEP